jgi:hypothetical protein
VEAHLHLQFKHSWHVQGQLCIYLPLLVQEQKQDTLTKFSTSVRGTPKLRNDEPSDLYSLPSIVRVVKSRRMRWEGRGVHRVLVRKPEGKGPLGRLRRRWEDNIKMDLQEVGGGCGDWMELAQDRDRWRSLVSTVRNLRVPKMWGIS